MNNQLGKYVFRVFVSYLSVALLIGCGPSSIEIENQSLKSEIEKLKLAASDNELKLREKDLEFQNAKIAHEQEKLEMAARLQALDQQIAQMASSVGANATGSAAVGVVKLADVYIEDMLPSSQLEVDSGLRLLDAIEQSPFLLNPEWDAPNDRIISFTGDVDTNEIAGRNTLKSIMIAATERYAESAASYASDIPGGSLIGSFIQKAATYTAGGVAENIPDSYLSTLQEVISTNLPPFAINIEFTTAQQTRIRSQKFIVKKEDGSVLEIPVPEEYYEPVLLDIAINENPVAMTALMLHEFALNQIKDMAIGLMKGDQAPPIAQTSESEAIN
jgi:hypothetical protein